MPFLSTIISWFTTKRMSQIDLFKKYPVDVQNEMFFNLITQAKDTEWGVLYNYEAIRNEGIEMFKNTVPISTYEDLKYWIDRIRDGKKNVMWNTEIKWFAKSSGTTNDKSKFIPISQESLDNCHYRGGRDVAIFYNNNYPNNRVFIGKSLIIGGSQQSNIHDNDIFYGDLSAVLLKNLPLWFHFRRTPDLSIALMDEWESKIEKMAQTTINENVKSISGVPSWTLVLIKRILEITGKSNLLEVWPNLELFIHGGVSFTPYREQYRKLIPSDDMRYLETYNASEGFFAIQDNPETDDMLLMLDYGVFYEFLPLEELNKPNPKTLCLDEVELDENYAIIISTNGGLWRYMIGDTVKFTSKYPHKIKITGRTKHFINAFGEEVIIDNAEVALNEACRQTNAVIREYTAAPMYMNDEKSGWHQWLIEFVQKPENFDVFARILDIKLKETNSDYEAKRYKDKILCLPEIVEARKDLFYIWLKEKGKLGGQHKVPRLANHREYMDELLLLNSKI